MIKNEKYELQPLLNSLLLLKGSPIILPKDKFDNIYIMANRSRFSGEYYWIIHLCIRTMSDDIIYIKLPSFLYSLYSTYPYNIYVEKSLIFTKKPAKPVNIPKHMKEVPLNRRWRQK